MRVIVVGHGVQGKKRMRVVGSDAVGVVDPVCPDAKWRNVRDAPLDLYDAALVCTPDKSKVEVLRHLLRHGKHALVEKPLYAEQDRDLVELETLARGTSAVCYTAYNHRFEPHYVRMRDLLQSGELGRIYRCRMFYGNGTARLVRDSEWRDEGAGVLPDLGSHLFDTACFWFGDLGTDFQLVSVSRFENRAPDHAVIASNSTKPKLEFEMTLLSWRNHFTCDIFAQMGTAHIESLCKWGPTTFTRRTRVLPSGRPSEESVTLVQDDPTWLAEYEHFKQLVLHRVRTDLSKDVWLLQVLGKLSAEATKMCA